MSEVVSTGIAEMKKVLRGDIGKIFFLKFKDITMSNAGPDVKDGSKAAPCRYLNAKMFNIEGDLIKLQIYFKRALNAKTSQIADEVEKFFRRE
jgi:hypothetical protein